MKNLFINKIVNLANFSSNKTMKLFLSICIILLFLTPNNLKAQEDEDVEEDVEMVAENALNALNQGQFDRAFKIYSILKKNDPDNNEYKYYLGICALNDPSKKEQALKIFQEQVKLEEFEESPFYLAKAYHVNGLEKEAIKLYKNFIANKPEEELDEVREGLYKEAEMGIKQCENLSELFIKKINKVTITNLGSPINTRDAEAFPILSLNNSKLYYSYIGPKCIGALMDQNMEQDAKYGVYNADVFMVTKTPNGSYCCNISVPSFNSKINDGITSISSDGFSVFSNSVSKDKLEEFINTNKTKNIKPENSETLDNEDFESETSKNDVSETDTNLETDKDKIKEEEEPVEKKEVMVEPGEDIYECLLNKDGTFSTQFKLNENINTEAHEANAVISADGRFLYFSSDRDGGEGGLDIYVSEKNEGEWGPAINLGPTINTPYDEDSPFIHPNGTSLFFSSTGHNSIGGFDVMYSELKNNYWSEVVNLGLQINTPYDDIGYIVSTDGSQGFFSSRRGLNGAKGLDDIYLISPAISNVTLPPIMLVSGKVTVDKRKVGGFVKVSATGYKYEKANIDPLTGEFVVALPINDDYQIKIVPKTELMVDTIIKLSTRKLSQFTNVTYTLDFMTHPEAKQQLIPSEEPPTIVEEKKENPTKQPAVDEKEEQPVANVRSNCSSLELEPLMDKVLYENQQLFDKLLQVIGNYNFEKITFKVQLGAFSKVNKSTIESFKKYGAVEQITTADDGLTRFYQGNEHILNVINDYRNYLIKQGLKGAWIVGYYNGNRYTLEQLIKNSFFCTK